MNHQANAQPDRSSSAQGSRVAVLGGHTRVPNARRIIVAVEPAAVGGASVKSTMHHLYVELSDRTAGWQRAEALLSLSEQSRLWGVSIKTVRAAMRELQRRALVEVVNRGPAGVLCRLPAVVPLEEGGVGSCSPSRWVPAAPAPCAARSVATGPAATPKDSTETPDCLTAGQPAQRETVRQPRAIRVDPHGEDARRTPAQREAIGRFAVETYRSWTQAALPLGPRLERDIERAGGTTDAAQGELWAWAAACLDRGLYSPEPPEPEPDRLGQEFGSAHGALRRAVELVEAVCANPFYSGKAIPIHPHHLGRPVVREPWSAWLQWLTAGRDGDMAAHAEDFYAGHNKSWRPAWRQRWT